MTRSCRLLGLTALVAVAALAAPALGQEGLDPAAEAAVSEPPKPDSGDTAWMLVSTAFVYLMVPGLALFYGGMVRRKNILATMMHSMAALAVVGVFWVVVGYALAFGKPWITLGSPTESVLGWNLDLVCLQGIDSDAVLPNGSIPVYVHMMFQGMFAILTPALISGAFAERIRFGPYCLFILAWVTLVYCPLAHSVWAFDLWEAVEPGGTAGATAVGFLGSMGALDFAGGTVVHIAAGMAGLAGALTLRKRVGYPGHAHTPSGLVLTLVGAALLWFGWFGFNAGSAVTSGSLAGLAFAVTQAGAAGAGLSWLLTEWLHRGKPTALGLASGFVAGLVAVTPAAGAIAPWAGLVLGLISGVVCYVSVVLVKNALGYDDSLDAFGIHGVGGFLGAVMTGVLAMSGVLETAGRSREDQVWIQTQAALIATAYSFGVSFLLIRFIEVVFGFATDERSEIDGLDITEHGEVGFDFTYGYNGGTGAVIPEPKPSAAPALGKSRFAVTVGGVEETDMIRIWSGLCQPSGNGPAPNFKAVYPSLTTIRGNTFYFRDGDPRTVGDSLRAIFQDELPDSKVTVQIQG